MNEHFYHFVPAKYNGLYLVLCTVAHSILMWVSIKQLDTKVIHHSWRKVERVRITEQKISELEKPSPFPYFCSFFQWWQSIFVVNSFAWIYFRLEFLKSISVLSYLSCLILIWQLNRNQAWRKTLYLPTLQLRQQIKTMLDKIYVINYHKRFWFKKKNMRFSWMNNIKCLWGVLSYCSCH